MSTKPKIKDLLDKSPCAHNKTIKVAGNAPTPGVINGGGTDCGEYALCFASEGK